MNRIKSLSLVIVLVVIILVLVLIRSTNPNLFTQETQDLVELAQQGKNTISVEKLNNLTSDFIVINLDSPENYNASQFKNSKNIPFETILEKGNQEIIEKTSAEIILFSENISTASKAWVILNQLGFENLHIIQNEEDSEVFKYEFQPDTNGQTGINIF